MLSRYDARADQPALCESLDERQFAALIEDSRPDELLVQARHYGVLFGADIKPSERHAMAVNALAVDSADPIRALRMAAEIKA